MPSPDHKDPAEAVIDSLKFAAGRECIIGKLAVARLTRLADLLSDTQGHLDFALTGIPAFAGIHAGRSGLHLKVSGELRLQCQRCMCDVEFLCDIDNRLMLLADEDEAAWPADELESDEFDAIPAERQMTVLALIEEEVMLALPIVPRHIECEPPELDRDPKPAIGKESVSSPFAALAGLKKQH